MQESHHNCRLHALVHMPSQKKDLFYSFKEIVEFVGILAKSLINICRLLAYNYFSEQILLCYLANNAK